VEENAFLKSENAKLQKKAGENQRDLGLFQSEISIRERFIGEWKAEAARVSAELEAERRERLRLQDLTDEQKKLLKLAAEANMKMEQHLEASQLLDQVSSQV